MLRHVRSVTLAVCVVAASHGACSAGPSDEQIAAQIEQQLANSPLLGDAEIDVMVRSGVVTLSGVVSSEEQRTRAESLARSVEGVDSVHTRLEIASSPPPSPPAVAAPPPPEAPPPPM